MKKTRLIARQKIISSDLHTVHNDFGLLTLDGIRVGETREIPDTDDPCMFFDSLIREFKYNNPDYSVSSFSIQLEDGNEIPYLFS